jgi:cellulose synthase/poly-beta-1,6-N-acetylglucosamine synthase-like glycosyltransferase
MDWYFYIALAAIVSQLLFLLQTVNNFRYALSKYRKKRLWQKSQVVLIVPCKGLDSDFQKNISSFFAQNYANYRLWFVVADQSDPAYSELCKLKDDLSQNSKARQIRILVAGPAKSCSQKIHNLLYCYNRIPDDVDILAFADSDISVRTDWLSHLVWPLRKPKTGASTGYRWFVPKNQNLAGLALSAINAKVAQLLGNTRFNQAWGGSMAIRVETFRQLGLEKIWPKTLSDDLSLGPAVKKAGLKVAFVPACLVASYQSITWRELFEFARRQFLITRVYAPGTWWFGLLSCFTSVLGLWATAAIAIYAAAAKDKNLLLYAAVPIVFFVSQLTQAILRQKMAGKLLEKDWPQLKPACAADILAFWAWSILLLFFIISSAFGNKLCWRGICYKLRSPTDIIILGNQDYP